MRELIFLLSATLALGPVQVAGQPGPPKLNLVIVEGEGAVNNIRQRTAREAIVQVQDENHRPVAGAAVVFTLPSQGASGTFANGARTLTVMTDNQGRAVAQGLRLNRSSGQMQIHVNASYEGAIGSAVITQTNMLGAAAGAAAGGISAKLLAIIIVAGAAAAGATVAAVKLSGNGGTAATPSTTISPGTGTVGPPR